MKVYSVDVPIIATLYVKAESREAAVEKAAKVKGLCLEVRQDETQEVPISGRKYDDPKLPETSFSPAMTIQQPMMGTLWIADGQDEEEDDDEPAACENCGCTDNDGSDICPDCGGEIK